jgi:hypothetical protein
MQQEVARDFDCVADKEQPCPESVRRRADAEVGLKLLLANETLLQSRNAMTYISIRNGINRRKTLWVAVAQVVTTLGGLT